MYNNQINGRILFVYFNKFMILYQYLNRFVVIFFDLLEILYNYIFMQGLINFRTILLI